MRSLAIVKVLIINDNGEVLFIRRSKTDTRRPGQWDWPGGQLEDGEDFAQGLKRECREEVGLQLKHPRSVYATARVLENVGNVTWNIFVEKLSGKSAVKLSFEHDAYRWMKPQAALQVLEYELHKTVLAYILQHDLLKEV